MDDYRMTDENRHCCTNPSCRKAFDKPKMLLVCPYCLTEMEEEKKERCRYWFGYLGQKEPGVGISDECIECEKALECMLNKATYSNEAVTEIKKWF
jgi:hypothetical protein